MARSRPQNRDDRSIDRSIATTFGRRVRVVRGRATRRVMTRSIACDISPSHGRVIARRARRVVVVRESSRARAAAAAAAMGD